MGYSFFSYLVIELLIIIFNFAKIKVIGLILSFKKHQF